MIGLHAMWNEHFGISMSESMCKVFHFNFINQTLRSLGVVECMAAGLIMVAHRSGGPLADIVETSEGSRNGYLAYHQDDYARTIVEILALTEAQRKTIKDAARLS